MINKPCHWTLKLKMEPNQADLLLEKLTASRRFDFTWTVLVDGSSCQQILLRVKSCWGHNLKELADILENSESENDG